MYKSFRVKNFRCFKDLQINDLGRVNLIAGKNNTGKTALLEAMYLHTQHATPQVLFHQQEARGLEVPDNGYPSYWKQFFLELDTASVILVSATYSKHVASRAGKPYPYSAELTIQELDENKLDETDQELYDQLRLRPKSLKDSLARVEGEERVLKLQYMWDNAKLWRPAFFSEDLIDDSIQNEQERSRFVPSQGRLKNDTIADQYSQLVLSKRVPSLLALLTRIEPRIKELTVLSPYGERMIWACVNGTRTPLRLLGEGTNRVTHFLMTMMVDRPQYLFLDEIENGIHYSVQKEVWKAIGQVARDLDIQVFATTHSYEMIMAAHEAFKDDGVDDFRFHRLYRDSTTGNIEARTYNEYSIHAAISRDREVRG